MKLPYILNKYHMRQVLLVVAILIDCFVTGAGLTFSATLLPQLSLSNSIISITESEGTWFAALLCLSCLPGTVIGCFILSWIGRKWTYACVALLNCIAWLIIAMSTQVWHLLVGRIVEGVAIGISYPVCICFISEVTSCKHRGSFFNITNVGMACGMLFADVMGTFQSWRLSAFVLAASALCYFTIFLYLNNTHVWYLNRNDLEGAKAAYFWYNRNTKENIKDFNEQVRHVEVYNATTRREYLQACCQREFYIPLAIILFYFTAQVFAGGYAISLYSVNVMQQLVAFDAYLTTMLIDVIRIFVAILTNIAIIYLPNRLIMNSSMVLSVVSLLVLCASIYWKNVHSAVQWIVLGALLSYNVFFNIALINMPMVAVGEFLTGITKPFGTSLAMCYMFGMTFLIALIIPSMFSELGSLGTFGIFTVCVIVGGIGLYFTVPETRNMSNEQIREYFKKTVL